MRATLTFRLPADRIEHMRALRGGDAIDALSAVSDRLRSITKHDLPSDVLRLVAEAVTRSDGDPQSIAEAIAKAVIDHARTMLWAEIRERGLEGVVAGDE